MKHVAFVNMYYEQASVISLFTLGDVTDWPFLDHRMVDFTKYLNNDCALI